MANDSLQFDRAEYGDTKAEAAVCASCGQRIWSSYFAVNDQVTCERCKTDVELQRSQGSGVGRFLRATVFGAGAGAVGAGLWYGVRAATGYEVGLIAIVVGFMVGAAVRKGSNGRGGWLYQALAMFLTYGSIVSTYVPFIVEGLKQAAAEETQKSASPAAEGAAPTKAGPDEPMSAGQGVVALVVVTVLIGVFAFAAPFLMGFQNIIGILIIGFGVYEAWKLNRRVPLEIAGPFRLGEAGPTATTGA
jgi:hypothetical protein